MSPTDFARRSENFAMNTPMRSTARSTITQPLLVVCARVLHLLALALWLGGLVAIGALVAPTAFHATRTAPALAGNLLQQNALAGAVVGGSLRLFNKLDFACAAVLLAANLLLLPHTSRRWTGACLGITLVLLASTLYLVFGLTPAMDTAQAHGAMTAFDQMHHLYEQLSTLFQMPLLLLLILFTALRDSPLTSTTG
jgi:uncharacterized membrane protein